MTGTSKRKAGTVGDVIRVNGSGGGRKVNFTVRLRPATIDTINQLARADGLDANELVRRAVELYETLRPFFLSDSKAVVVVRHSDGSTQEVRLKY